MPAQADQHHAGIPRWAWGLMIGAGTWLLFFLLQQGGDQPVAQYIEGLEHRSLDMRFKLREKYAPSIADDSIIILTVDQYGIEYRENQVLLYESRTGETANFGDTVWPWPRADFGSLAPYLKNMGARAVFFDFLYTGQSVHDGFRCYEDGCPAAGAGGGEDSNWLAWDCADSGITHHAILFNPPETAIYTDEEIENDPILKTHFEIADAVLERIGSDALTKAELPIPVGHGYASDSVQMPLPAIVEAAASIGGVNASVDSDGIIRRGALLFDFRGKAYSSSQVSLLRSVLGISRFELDADAGTLAMDDIEIPIDDKGQMLINWHGPEGTYTTLPLHTAVMDAGHVANGGEPILSPDDFAGKIVLLGASAAGLQDLKPTPLDGKLPGVEVHATILDNIMNEDFLRRPSEFWSQALTLLLFLVAAQLLVRRQSASMSLTIFLLLLGGTLGIGIGLFISETLWLDLVVPVVGLGLLFGEAQTVQYFTEGKQKRQIRNVFQRYLPSTVVNEVLKVAIEDLKLGGERKELTVFFSDIEGFTNISESLGPEELVSMLNVYLSEMSDIVGRHGATLDKYIGDCIMAFWGAPLPVENGAVQACMAALENQERLAVLREQFVSQGLPALRARIGINTGDVLVGNMGSDSHFAYTVMGDEVNLASRLEGANKQYGTYIMLGENTYEIAKDEIEVRFLDLVRVKGRQAPSRVYELMARKGELEADRTELRTTYTEGIELYAKEQWSAAQERFEAGLKIAPGDGPCRTYVARCEHFSKNPPPSPWDGVYTMSTK